MGHSARAPCSGAPAGGSGAGQEPGVAWAGSGVSGQAAWSPWALARGAGVREGPPSKAIYEGPHPRGHYSKGGEPSQALWRKAAVFSAAHADRRLWLQAEWGRAPLYFQRSSTAPSPLSLSVLIRHISQCISSRFS